MTDYVITTERPPSPKIEIEDTKIPTHVQENSSSSSYRDEYSLGQNSPTSSVARSTSDPHAASPSSAEYSEDFYSCTQDAMDGVTKDIAGLKRSLCPEISQRQRDIMRIGKDVKNLTQEVQFLRNALRRSESEVQYFKRRLEYFESREESEMVKESIATGRENDMSVRKNLYSTYAPRNFRSDFNFSKRRKY